VEAAEVVVVVEVAAAVLPPVEVFLPGAAPAAVCSPQLLAGVLLPASEPAALKAL
jgi:hypothetical protein